MENSPQLTALFVILALAFVELGKLFVTRMSKKNGRKSIAPPGCNTFTALDREALKRLDTAFGHKGMVAELIEVCKDGFRDMAEKEKTIYKTVQRLEKRLN